MPEKHLYEYAVIRIVPRMEREEFINAGVILYCRSKRFLKAKVFVDEERVACLFPGLDIETVRGNLESLKSISDGSRASGPIAQMDAASRFRWLTAIRSTVVQTSRVHPGFCPDPELALEGSPVAIVTCWAATCSAEVIPSSSNEAARSRALNRRSTFSLSMKKAV